MLKTVLTVALFSFLIFPQENDSLFFQNDESASDTTITSISDTSAIADTSKITETVAKDTLVPIQGEPLADVSTIISKRTFLFENYRYTGDLLRSFSLNFVKNLGFVGYPHETFIYGVGNNGISYLQDGLLINNRFTNSLDLNFVQSEDIDSIEIVPSPRGFLYGPYNNPIAVNFITRDFVPPVPYSRIKYYEGPDGEAMIDGKFNVMVANRWNFAFQATNRIVDETYTNTEFSIWQVNTKLKYFLSNSVNITGSYYFVASNQGLNGGVDYDSLTRSSDDPNADLYEPFSAPVLYPNRTLDVTQHNFRLRTLAKPFENSQMDFSVYYWYGLDEERTENDTSTAKRDWNSKILGVSIDYEQGSQFLNLNIHATYEKYDVEEVTENFFASSTLRNNSNIYYSIGGILTGNILNKVIVPSIFYKYENKDFGDGNTVVNPGYGFDLKIAPIESMNFYIGYSKFNQLNDEDADLLELGWRFHMYNLGFDLKYFEMKNFIPYLPDLWSLILTGAEIGYPIYSAKGLGFSADYKFWIMLIESNLSYYNLNTSQNYNLPDLQFVGGLFINDFFFDNNLELKTGFKFYYTGEISVSSNIQDVEPSNKLDFNLAGEIKNVFIFYFQWENLLGNQYYITPYYPMPERNIRFGLAWELFN